MIGRLVLRSIRANLIRFLLTTFAVFAGVAFVAAAFGLADQLRGVINTSDLPTVGPNAAGTLQVAPSTEGFGPPPSMDTALADEIAKVEGVAFATPTYFSFVEFGAKVERNPALGGFEGVAKAEAYSDRDWKIVSGRAPAGPNEVALDSDGKLAALTNPGASVDILLPTGKESFAVVGEVARNGDGPGGLLDFIKATAVFDPDNVGRVAGAEGSANGILVTVAPGADLAGVKAALQKALPDTLEVFSGDELAAQFKNQLLSIADGLERAMLIFAGITLFVSTFLVVNTFTMIIGQRMRELGLLRAVGADRSQIFTMVTAEAVFIGVVASVLGLIAGVALATIVGGLINSEAGFSVILTGRTVGMALIIGIGVTLVSAIAPALRAAGVQPLAAINGVDGRQEKSSNWPTFAAAGAVVFAVVLLLIGFGDGLSFAERLGSLVPGAVLLFVALAVLSRFVAAPVMRLLSAPFRRVLAAHMGASNAARNPRRTAITASALMIGLALIISIVTVGNSVRNALLNQFKTSTNAELFLSTDGFVSIDGEAIGEAVQQNADVELTADYSTVSASIQGDTSYRITRFTTAPISRFTEMFDLGIKDGGIDSLDSGSVLIAADAAEKMGVSAGDKVTVQSSSGDKLELSVEATYDKTAIADQAVIDSEAANELALGPNFQGLAIKLADGTDLAAATKEIETATEGFPAHEVQTKADIEADFKEGFDVILRIISALLIASVLIAGLGVMNTLILSVIERTREIGLLRAVGATRRQIRSTIRWEALLTSVFGAILGILVGSGLGYGVVMALPKNFVSTATPPISWMILSLIFAIILGLLASVIPAFRASRMDVLKAIATDR